MKFLVDFDQHSAEVRLEIIKETSNNRLINYAKNSEDPKERGAVALNPNLSTAELDVLSHDPNDYVKGCVLRNRKTLGETIDRMLDNNSSTPNENLIVNHKNVLKKTLERFLQTHIDTGLRIIAERRLKCM